jgi:hypothetical protein
VLSSDQKGAVAELEIATRAAELGIGVWAAYTVERYDLIFDLRPGLVRVQCKWASVYRDVIVVRCDRNRRNRAGLVRRFYSPDEIDAFAAYCAEVDRCYFLPLNWARNYEFAATLGRRGAIAQLGERRLGMAEVAGSSPAGSTR